VQKIEVIDSHTGGEPTRVVVAGGPQLGFGSLAERRDRFRIDFDSFRSAVVNEPRGSDVLVGALLVEPRHPDSAAAVIFFNNVGFLGMCGHGVLGVIATLAHMGRIGPGAHRVETPVGIVNATLHEDGEISLVNVPSWRAEKGVTLDVPGIGPVTGDVAWGGNWFFLTGAGDHGLTLANVDALTDYSRRIRQAAKAQGFAKVDHVELVGPARSPGADARNFVLCPGNAYDRSPCGTGTSAKLACLAADGVLEEGDEWVQESLIGSRFRSGFRWLDRSMGTISPTITGTAHVTGEATLLLDRNDPFCWGISAA
jgi:proline racemase